MWFLCEEKRCIEKFGEESFRERYCNSRVRGEEGLIILGNENKL
jgi:hypothetical protein